MSVLDLLAEAGELGVDGWSLELLNMGVVPVVTGRVFMGDPLGGMTRGIDVPGFVPTRPEPGVIPDTTEVPVRLVLLRDFRASRRMVAAILAELSPGKPTFWEPVAGSLPTPGADEAGVDASVDVVVVCDEDTRYRVAELIEDGKFESGFFEDVVFPLLQKNASRLPGPGGMGLVGKGELEPGRPLLVVLTEGGAGKLWVGRDAFGGAVCTLFDCGLVQE